MTIWEGYISSISKLEHQEFQAKRAGLELDIKDLESQRTLLKIDVNNLNTEVLQFEDTKAELEHDYKILGTQNIDLQQQPRDSERELVMATERLVCREIDFAIRAIKDLAYSLAAYSDHYNFSALSTIAEREKYLSPDDAENFRDLESDFWYIDWKEDVPWFDDDVMARSIAAQGVAQIVVGAIDAGSFFLPSAMAQKRTGTIHYPD